MVDSGEISEIDWDNLLENIPDDLNFDFFDDLNLPLNNEFSLSTSPDSACLQSIDDVEQYLFNDADFSDDGQKKVEEDVAVQVKENDTVADTAGAVVVDADDNDDDNAADENDDPAAKKRKRQMRNRDAAIRSRERKKSYVKDLEMKSKYYEAECKRLGILFQCCLAENQALRLSLHNKAFDASMSKQESAVLFLESLLLGSLLGFLGIICLQILLLSTLEVGRLKSVLSAKKGRAPPRKAGNEVFKVPVLQSFMMGKGCRASRSRMKTDIFWVS